MQAEPGGGDAEVGGGRDAEAGGGAGRGRCTHTLLDQISSDCRIAACLDT